MKDPAKMRAKAAAIENLNRILGLLDITQGHFHTLYLWGEPNLKEARWAVQIAIDRVRHEIKESL